MKLRIGEGIDRHPLREGRPLILGGIRIESSRGLVGHSDGDALTHAICDAVLGSVALGDLGGHFADTDPAQRDRSSSEFLLEVVRLAAQRGWRVGNVDATVIAEAPLLAPHLPAMREALARSLGVAVDEVSVKATRGEGLGPEGRGEAITVHAVVLMVPIAERGERS
jgi:2-C-methyl-D-erythritol 2,4-cyclodiphosphate synthase